MTNIKACLGYIKDTGSSKAGACSLVGGYRLVNSWKLGLLCCFPRTGLSFPRR